MDTLMDRSFTESSMIYELASPEWSGCVFDPTGTGTGGESIWGEDFDNEVCEELLKRTLPLREVQVLYVWMEIRAGIQNMIIGRMLLISFYRAGESRYSEERSGRRECRAHKETTSVILGSGWISILNRKLYCVWTNDQWI